MGAHRGAADGALGGRAGHERVRRGEQPSTAGTIVEAENVSWHDQPFSVTVRVARLSTLYLVPAAG